jgi:hypothetical protein
MSSPIRGTNQQHVDLSIRMVDKGKMIDRFLILGAGASHGGRSVSPPPLGKDLAKYLLNRLETNRD